jgi:DNA-binding NarL/FixJ family response regulator
VTGQPHGRVRVLVVDDHSLFRSGVRTEIEPAMEVVGEAGDVAAAISQIHALQSDVVLLDVHLPGGGGRAVLDAMLATHPEVRFLALSVSDAADDVIGVIRGGARGYVVKAISGPELCEAIRQVHAGDVYFSPRLAGFVLDAFRGDPPVHLDPELDQLTVREREVLRLIASGYTYKEAAARLHISARTVETHVSAVLRKLQLSSRREWNDKQSDTSRRSAWCPVDAIGGIRPGRCLGDPPRPMAPPIRAPPAALYQPLRPRRQVRSSGCRVGANGCRLAPSPGPTRPPLHP